MAKKKSQRRAQSGGGAGAKKGSRATTVTFVASHMRKNPDISMTELQELGRAQGHNVYPLIIGLARKELGMAPGRKAGPAKRPGRPKGVTVKTRGPGRPRATTTTGSAADLLGEVVQRMRELEREADGLRKALEKIASVATSI